MGKRSRIVAFCLLVAGTSGASFAILRTQSPNEPPAELVKLGIGTASKAAYTDVKHSWYDWDTLQQTVSVDRRERQTINDAWHEQVQVLSASFYIIDVRWTCNPSDEIKYLYVAGVYPNGDACIEEWKFTNKVLSGAYVPIDQRPLPLVRRTEIYRGSQLGHVQSLEPDPDRRFLLFLTFETPAVYRIDLPSGAPQLALSQSQQPYLAHARQIVARNHLTEGRQFHMLQDPRWEADLSVSRQTVILHDAQNDGVFESSETITSAQWTQRGYDDLNAWVAFCSNLPF